MVVNYSCPNCGADMSYSIELGKLHCDHCDHSEEIVPDSKESTQAATEAETKEYHCPNCGGLLTTEDKTCSTHCEFCGAPLVLADRLTDKMRPQQVLPFKVNRTQVAEAFKKWCKNGLLTPAGFMSAKNISEIKGMYIPYWLYDMDTDVALQAEGTRVNIYRLGDVEYTETSFFAIEREMKLAYRNLPYDGSEKMDDELMHKLEPYDFSQMEVFNMPYLAGFKADQYDYDDQELMPRVKDKAADYATDHVRGTISGYSTVNVTNRRVNFDNVDTRYVYLPIWFISYNYRNQNYIFAMNGQTGKVIGKPPLSQGKIAAWFGGIAAVVFALLMLIGGLF